MLDIRPVLFISGFLLLILAAAMGVPMAVDLAGQKTQWHAFLMSGLLTAFVGCALILANRAPHELDLSVREAFALTVTAWVLSGVLAAVPFAQSSLHLSWTDSLFESFSGLTTTGATVLTGLDHMPSAILMWRSMLQWLGGVGIIVTAVALLPILRIGGMQLFRMESSDKTHKTKARISQIAWGILAVYSAFTIALTLALHLAGMTPLEAICHAMSSISTGGFSTSDKSLGNFSDAARWICMLGMLLGGATFSQYLFPWKGRHHLGVWQDSQFRWYLSTIAFFALLLTFWNWAVGDMTAYHALRASAFNVVSLLSTTGFHTDDYNSWGGFAEVVFFFLAFVGGCTGSTAGGIKIFRYEVLFAMAGNHLKRLLHPNGVFIIDFNQQKVSDLVVRSVLSFMMLYFFCFALLALGLSMTGLDAVTSLSGAAAAIGNVGPGLGHLIGPGGTYHSLPDMAKWLLTFGMLLGRLELAPFIILFTTAFWRE